MILLCPVQGPWASSYQIRPGVDPWLGKKESKRASKTKGFTWNAAILVAVSVRYSKGWIEGGQKKVEEGLLLWRNPPSDQIFTATYWCIADDTVDTFIWILSFWLSFFWLNWLLLVIRWAIKGPWASSFLGSWEMNRSAEQTNRVNREAVLVRFVCSALRFISHEPREKDTRSLYLQCLQQRPLLKFSKQSKKFKIPAEIGHLTLFPDKTILAYSFRQNSARSYRRFCRLFHWQSNKNKSMASLS